MNDSKRLSVVGSPTAPSLVESVTRCVDQAELSRRMRLIYFNAVLKHYVVPARFNNQIKIMPLSPVFGMGFEFNPTSKEPTAYIDQKFLEEVLESQPCLIRPATVRYFVLSTVAHAVVRDKIPIVEARKNGDDFAMITAWKWGGRLALDELDLNEQIETELVTNVRQVAKTYEDDYAQEMLYFTHQAVMHGVDPPKIKPVVPWIGLAYPEAPLAVS